MPAASPPLPAPASPSALGWKWDVVILALAVTVVYCAIGSHPPLGSAMRYAAAAREMAQSHDWVVPTLDYAPYFEKPIFTYWLGAWSQMLFGDSPMAVQLPSALASFISLLATYALGRRWRGPAFGLFAALLLLFSGMFLVFTSVFLTDTILSACLAVAWYTFYRHDQLQRQGGTDRQSLPWLCAFYLAVALGILTKGPVAFVLIGCAVAGYFLMSRGVVGMWTNVWRARPFLGLIIMALVNLPWNLLVWQRDPRLFEYFYSYINYQAFFDPKVNHPGPFYYYATLLVVMLAPWSFVAVPALVRALYQGLHPSTLRALATTALAPVAHADASPEAPVVDQGQLYLCCVVVFPLLFLSVSASKLGTYALPLYPAVLLLVADQFWRLKNAPPGWLRLGLLAQGVAFLIAAGLYAEIFARPDDLRQVESRWWPVIIGTIACFLACGMWAGIEASRGRLLRGLAITSLGLFFCVSLLLPNAFTMLKYIDARALARVAAEHAGDEDVLIVSPDCVQDYSILWEVSRPLDILIQPKELGMGLYIAATPPGSGWPVSPQTHRPSMSLKDLTSAQVPGQRRLWSIQRLLTSWNQSKRIWLFAEEPTINALLDNHAPLYEIGRTDKIILVTNQAISGLTGRRLAAYQRGVP